MSERDRQELMHKSQFLDLFLMMLSQTNEEFFDGVKRLFGYAWDGKGWINEFSLQWPNTQHAGIQEKILQLKSPASEGKYDASGASTFRVTGDHYWIAVTEFCKKDAKPLN